MAMESITSGPAPTTPGNAASRVARTAVSTCVGGPCIPIKWYMEDLIRITYDAQYVYIYMYDI